jgi:leucyl-tRNA synthetase
MEFPADADNQTIQDAVLADDRSKKYIEGEIMKVIIVPKRMVNIVFKK